MRLPDFIIVGAMKAATTSFADDLCRHPMIEMPARELHFFNSEGNFKKGLEYYSSFFDTVPPHIRAGEKTPSYSYHPLVPQRIAEALPEVKLIWLFREPVSRTYSHYNFFVGRGKEWRTFSHAVKRELNYKEINFIQKYLDRSKYVKQVEKYLQYFPKSQMLFLLYEDYLNNKRRVLDKTFEFLEVATDQYHPPAAVPKNVTYLPRSSFLQWLAYRIFRYRFYRLYALITKWNRKPVSGYKSMDRKINTQLKRVFEPYNLQLSQLTGLDLSIWQKSNSNNES